MTDQYQFPDEQTPAPDSVAPQDDSALEIQIVDDTPEIDKGRRPLDTPVADPTEDELQGYSDAVKARIKKLTHARHDERRQREAIQRERDELVEAARRLAEENRGLKKYVNTGEQQYAATVKHAVSLEVDAVKKELRAALDAGDVDKIVEAQAKLADATGRLQQANNFRPTPLQTEQPVVQQQAPAPQQPVVDPKTLSWQAKNQWFGAEGRQDMTSLALGLHQKLVTDGVDPRSDEYFARIDARMRTAFPEFFGSAQNRGGASASTQRSPSPVAPAGSTTARRKVTLSASQARVAEKLGLTAQQYAAEVLKLENMNG